MTDAAKPLTRRRLIQLLGVWAVGIGLVLAAASLLWHPLLPLGVAALTTGVAWLLTSPFASTDIVRAAMMRNMRLMLLAIGGYFVAMLVLHMARHLHLPSWALALTAMLPVLMLLLVVVAEWRNVRDSDELERHVQLLAMHVAGGTTGILAFAVGMLKAVGVLSFNGGLILVMPVMFLLYGVASWWYRRKYGLEGVC